MVFDISLMRNPRDCFSKVIIIQTSKSLYSELN